MACARCGQNNFSWARICAHCGHSLSSSATTNGETTAQADVPAAPQPPPERELQLAIPETEDPAAQDARMISDALAHTSSPVVMPALCVCNVLVFVAMVMTGASPLSPDRDALLRWGATYGPSITDGEWWRLLTAMFMHAGIVHLLFNMLALFNIGALVERMFGRVPFLVLYLLAGVGGSLASVYWHPLSVSVGASGAILGVYGGLGGFLLRARKALPSEIVATLRNNAVAFVLYNGVIGFTQPNIDMAAHLGGLAIGLVAGVALATAAGLSATRLPRTLAVGLAGAVAFAFAVTRLPGSDDWIGAVRTLAQLETHSNEVTQAAMQKVTDGSLDDAAFARVLEEQVVAPWRQHRDRIAAMKQLPAKERSLAAKATVYMDHRAAAWQLEADAFRREDMTLMTKSNVEQIAARDAADDFLRTLGINRPQSPPARSTPAVGGDAGGRNLTQAVEVVGRLEATSVRLYNSNLERVRARTLSPSAFADLIETQIAGPWDQELTVIATLHASGPVEGSRKQVEKYMRLRGDGWHLSARAFRTDSETLLKQANDLFIKAAALASSISSDAATKP